MQVVGRALNELQNLRWRVFGSPRSFGEMFAWEEANGFSYTLRNARWQHRYDFNISDPKSFNEKIVHRRLFSRDPIWPLVTDKVGLREWAQSTGVADAVKFPEALGIYGSPSDIPEALVGQPIVLKAAWASGLNLFMDKQSDQGEWASKVRRWHEAPYGVTKLVWAAQNMPRRFIAEEKLQAPDGEVPRDYKFFVFHGQAAFCQIDFDRFENHQRNYYDMDGRRLDFTFGASAHKGDDDIDIGLYRQMASAAERIAQGFDFVRVDLYSVGGKIYLGEITQSPGAGFNRLSPSTKDFEIGQLWHYDPSVPSYQSTSPKHFENGVQH